ncbi:hypothetical protein Lfu02_10370 [Longispora fulva]|uniref:Uncharacterized protein n=1 Tax=Longispora fulva TaxID=619741 RepID=A0A8J7G8W6_9ACTN|nr:hypothetical protein [Longispora fulva]GIG56665.1 hypothetical protein Lfu02_10370 [Longispora fulva]
MARVLRSVVIGAAVLIAVVAVTSIVRSRPPVESGHSVAGASTSGTENTDDFTWQ